MLFDIDKDGDIKDTDPKVLAIPAFKDLYKTLGSDYIKWLVMMYDYDSPYRMSNPAKKSEIIIKDIFKDKIPDLQNPVVRIAVEKYRSIQYDEILEQEQVFSKKISEITELMRLTKVDLDNAERVQKIMEANSNNIAMLLEIKKKANDIRDRGKVKVKGGGEKSFLEANIQNIHNNL